MTTGTNNAIYHENKCIYETNNALYDLYELEINPRDAYSYYYTYQSSNNPRSPFYNKWIALYLNICNKSSVKDTQWNKPPNTLSLDQYITKSTVLCSTFLSPLPFTADTNESALCTQMGQIAYDTQDFMVEFQHKHNSALVIDLGQTQCLYYILYNSTLLVRAANIFIHLVVECDVNAVKTEIISVDGPLFSMDSRASGNYPCSKNITITMLTNTGCPKEKILANKSIILCPKSFNQTTQIINCTLFTQANDRTLTGNMDDIKHKYLAVFAEFGTKTHNVTINMDIKCNESGVFNITFNATDIMLHTLNNTKRSNWRNISIYAAANYPIGPNTTTPNVSLLFVHFDSSASSVFIEYFARYASLALTVFVVLYLCCRLRDEEARKFCCLYCMRCRCLTNGLRACLVGSYIFCCDCSKSKKGIIENVMNGREKASTFAEMDGVETNNANDSISFWGILKDKLSKSATAQQRADRNGSQLSEYSASTGRYESMSDFLYRQPSSYGRHIGVGLPLSSGSINKQSICSDDYVL